MKVPRGYVILRVTIPVYAEILVAEDDLVVIDRYISRGDVVKRNPLDAQSGTLIGSSSICTLRPSFAVIDDKQGNSPMTNFVQLTSSPMRGVDMHDLVESQFWKLGDTVIYQDWLGIITDVQEELTVKLDGGGVVIITDTEDVDERILSPTTSISDYVKFDSESQQKPSKVLMIPARSYHYGQRIRTTRKVLSRSRWLVGSYKPQVKPIGVIINVMCEEVEVDWKLPRVDNPKSNISPKPGGFLRGDVLESGAVRLYDLSHGTKEANGIKASHLSVTPQFIHVGDYVMFRDVRTAKPKYGDQLPSGRLRTVLSTPSTTTTLSDSGIIMSQIISTTSTVKVRWQDNSVTDELSTSVCPYDEVDDHDAWPGELVSLKDQEDSYQDPSYEKWIRTHAVGVVQSVNAVERIALVRWFEGADVTITGEDHDKIVRSYSTLGHITENVTVTSLYEIEAHRAMVKRRGDIVRILQPEQYLAGLSLPASTTQSASDVNGGNDWYGEVVDLFLDGRVLVRLGGLENVHDITCSMLDLDVAASADDDTTESATTTTESTMDSIMDDVLDEGPQVYEEIGESLYNKQARYGRYMPADYQGSVPFDSDGSGEDQWMTDSNGDLQSETESPQQREHEVSTMNATEVQDHQMDVDDTTDLSPPGHSYETQTEPSPEDASRSTITSGPASFAILEGSSSKHTFAAQPGRKPGKWLKAVFREHQIMRSSLPEGVYVRTWEASMELIRVLIVGPSGTPYALAPFLFDIHLNEQFPYYAPNAFFHSWTNGIGRVNPNLYEDGKVCLSLLGTWHSEKDAETWVTGKSSILQIIVSLLGLVLVKEPYYRKSRELTKAIIADEAGYEALQGTAQSKPTSALYSEKAFVLSRRFIAKAIESPPVGFADIVRWLYLPSPNGPSLLQNAIEDCRQLLQDDSLSNLKEASQHRQQLLDKYHITSPKLSQGVLVLLQKMMPSLENMLRSYEKPATTVQET
ncbi:MAG: hypothetical protein Q9225_007204 [Loekoesia sp. 1 TL-2023]